MEGSEMGHHVEDRSKDQYAMRQSELHIGVAMPAGCTDIAVLVAAARAGELPILDFTSRSDLERFERYFLQLHGIAGRRLCLRVQPQIASHVAAFLEKQGASFDFLLLSCAVIGQDYSAALAVLRPHADMVL